MKKEMIAGATAPASSIREEKKEKNLLEVLIPDDCKIGNRSDLYQAMAVGFIAAGLIFPPLFIGAAVCVALSKKGGNHA